jgi:hypothetical protein
MRIFRTQKGGFIMNQSEHHEQASYISYCRNSPILGLRFAYAVPNGVKVSVGQARKLKREGLLPGTPDVVVPIASKQYHSLYLEFKTRNGRMSDKQELMKAYLESAGFYVGVPRSHGEAIEITERYLRGEV